MDDSKRNQSSNALHATAQKVSLMARACQRRWLSAGVSGAGGLLVAGEALLLASAAVKCKQEVLLAS